MVGIFFGLLFILWSEWANASEDCVVYNVEHENGAMLFLMESAKRGAIPYESLSDHPDWIPRDEVGKPYPGEWKAVCRNVPGYIAGDPMHCVHYNRDDGVETLCQWQIWGGQSGYWTEHGEWVDYADPCASYDGALKRGEKLPNEPTCTGVDDGRPMPFIPRDGSEISA